MATLLCARPAVFKHHLMLNTLTTGNVVNSFALKQTNIFPKLIHFKPQSSGMSILIPRTLLTASASRSRLTACRCVKLNFTQCQRHASSKGQNAFNINPRVARDTLIFSYSHDFYYNSISLCAITMAVGLIFQAYVTIVDFSKIKIKIPPTEGKKSWRQRFKEWVVGCQWTVLATTYIFAGKFDGNYLSISACLLLWMHSFCGTNRW